MLFNVPAAPLLVQFGVHLCGFFFTCLVCAHALAARRPHPARLTEFYLWMSIGGVLGGAFNDGKGQPAQSNAVSHGSSTSRFNGVNVINTARKI